jgi:hypothetical protein
MAASRSVAALVEHDSWLRSRWAPSSLETDKQASCRSDKLLIAERANLVKETIACLSLAADIAILYAPSVVYPDDVAQLPPPHFASDVLAHALQGRNVCEALEGS